MLSTPPPPSFSSPPIQTTMMTASPRSPCLQELRHHSGDSIGHNNIPSLVHLPHNDTSQSAQSERRETRSSSSIPQDTIHHHFHHLSQPIHPAVAASNLKHKRQLSNDHPPPSTSSFPPLGNPISSNNQQHQQQQQSNNINAHPMLVTLEEERHKRRQVEDAEGLSMLCSQHHKSEYNRLKWGDKGAPIYYVPLSIQLPSHVSALMDKQAHFESICAQRSHAASIPSKEPSVEDKSFHATTQLADGESGRPLEEEEGLEGLLVSSSTSEVPAGPGDGRGNGTSPPVVSAQILEAISSPITNRNDTSPAPPAPSPSLANTTSSPLQDLKTSASTTQGTVPFLGSQGGGEVFSSIEAGRAKYSGAAAGNGPMGENGAGTGAGMGSNGMPGVVVSQPVKTSDTHPINISIIIPPHLIPLLAPLLPLVSANPLSSSNTPFRLPPLLDLYAHSLSSPAIDIVPSSSTHPSVGNFLLSSCPGKKVRLTGPVKGRGAICRDLKRDLERIKGLGVGCIICCLDDEELSYLGAPFEEYESNAKIVGLDVIRIPMPEGLTPTSLPSFDSHLDKIISTYTLSGVNVLAHCRGGVGRAGLVASCWAVKMGLVAPSPSPSSSPNSGETEIGFGDEIGSFREDELEIVEKVVGVVRRRRSVKAIETFEQVRWLVEYVRWLRIEGRVVGE